MSPETANDPVCGMTIPLPAAQRRTHHGVEFHFCSDLCAHRFDADGDAYATVSRMNLPGWGRTARPGFLTQDDAAPAPVSRSVTDHPA